MLKKKFSSKEGGYCRRMDKEFQIIANNIKCLREKKGFTQEQLAEAVDLSASHLSKVESGQSRIGMKAYISILQVLGVGEEEFVSVAVDEKKGSDFKKFQDVMKDCNMAERKFLLDSLEGIKTNMKKLLREHRT